jgi:hypothetical protein
VHLVAMLEAGAGVPQGTSDQRHFGLLFLRATARAHLEVEVEAPVSKVRGNRICTDRTRRHPAGWLAGVLREVVVVSTVLVLVAPVKEVEEGVLEVHQRAAVMLMKEVVGVEEAPAGRFLVRVVRETERVLAVEERGQMAFEQKEVA